MQFVSEYAFSDDGMLSGWDVYVNRQCSITLQVFRPSGTDYTYDLVDSTVANVNVGANSIPAWIEVEAGDVLGWYQSGVQPIVFDNGGLIVRRAYGYTGSDSTVSMSGHAGGWNRMYSISATVEPIQPNMIVGYDAISREIADTGTGMQFVSEYAFSDDGMLSGWDVYVNRQCSITLQVFRPSGTDYTYDLVDSTVANVNVGANSIPAWIEVEAGDVLGWYQSGVQPIVFDNGGLIVRRAYGYTGSDSTVSMSGHAGGWNRMYSISATVGPTSGRRQMRLMQMSEGEKNVKNARLYDDRQMKQAQKL